MTFILASLKQKIQANWNFHEHNETKPLFSPILAKQILRNCNEILFLPNMNSALIEETIYSVYKIKLCGTVLFANGDRTR